MTQTTQNEGDNRLLRFYLSSRRVGLSLFRPVHVCWRGIWLVGVIGISPDGERLTGGRSGSKLRGYPAAFFIRAALDLPANSKPNGFQGSINSNVLYAVDLSLADGNPAERGRPYLPPADQPLPLLGCATPSSNGGIITGVLIRADIPDNVEPASCIACVAGYHFFDSDRGTVLINTRTVLELCEAGSI